jgi:WD40 repeat protein
MIVHEKASTGILLTCFEFAGAQSLKWDSGHFSNVFQAKTIGYGNNTIVSSARDGQVRIIRTQTGYFGCLDWGALRTANGSGLTRARTLVITSMPCHGMQFEWKKSSMRAGSLHVVYLSSSMRVQVRLHHISNMGRVHTKRIGRHQSAAHKLAKHPTEPHCFYSSAEDGDVRRYDIRERNAASEKLLSVYSIVRPRVRLNSASTNRPGCSAVLCYRWNALLPAQYFALCELTLIQWRL